MRNKPSSITPILIGFGICLLLILPLSTIAWYAIENNQSLINHFAETCDAHVLTEQSLRHFNTMELALLRFRETKDLAFDKQIREHFRGAVESMRKVRSQNVINENREQSDFQLELYGQFMQLHEKDVHISQQLDRMEPDGQETATLLALQREIRDEQDILATETKDLGNVMLERSLQLQMEFAKETEMFSLQTRRVVSVFTVIAMFFVFGVCTMFAMKSNRPSPLRNTNEFSSPSSPGDLQIVADKLQEVVDLLRKSE